MPEAKEQALLRELKRVRELNRNLKSKNQVLRKILAMSNQGKLMEVIESAMNNYSGGHFDRLNEDSKVLTAIAWDDYPSASFDSLVEKVQKFKPEWAEILNKHGVAYFVIAQGDSFRASGFDQFSGIACDTEEWYEDIPQGCKAFEDDDDDWCKLNEFIAEFARDVVAEIEEYLEVNDISLEDLQAVFAKSEEAA